jgi:hypothetical protein
MVGFLYSKYGGNIEMKKIGLILLISLVAAGWARAAKPVVTVNDNIATSTTWDANSIYNLGKQIYVLPGATLTIKAGTLVQTTANSGGSLAVCRGAKIYANGTVDAPVIMTSTKDDLKSWHEGCNEWGNLTIMGNALINCSSQAFKTVTINGRTNTKIPDGLNQNMMEGLTADFAGDTKQLFGGNNDDDSSGALRFLSLRYGGKVVGLGNELNGLSMGGIGRGTEVDHIEVMNNVDDGIETWGGTVNYKYITVWNIGDDCFDVDEGWRGKAQFGLLVQGYSVDAAQGSGTGDNMIEVDGAEDSDAQPVTTAAIYNFTCVGQPGIPNGGDQGIALRDNARVQFHNMIFMNVGEQVIKNDKSDGDNANGYGYNGTLSFDDTWKTPATASFTVPTVNPWTFTAGAFNDPKVMYRAQDPNGKLLEVKDSIFFQNFWTSTDGKTTAYTQLEAVGVMDAKNNNIKEPGTSPIQKITRGPKVVKGGLDMYPVTFINPRAASLDSIFSVTTAPDDGFFTPVQYRGAFDPYNNWLVGWTSVWAYGMTN